MYVLTYFNQIFVAVFLQSTAYFHNPVLFYFSTTDVEDIKFVINFDYPNSSEDYVHRIGRTARANNTGTAYTFFTQGNAKQASDLVNVLREANQQVNPKLLQLVEAARYLGKGRCLVYICNSI